MDSQKSRSSRDASSFIAGLATSLVLLLPAKKSSNIGSDEVAGTPTYSEATCPVVDDPMSINDSNPPLPSAVTAMAWVIDYTTF